MRRRTKVVTFAAIVAVGTGCAIGIWRASRRELYAPVLPYVVNDRQVLVENSPAMVLRLIHLKGVELEEVHRMMLPSLKENGYVANTRFAGPDNTGYSSGTPPGKVIEFWIPRVYKMDGVIIVDRRHATWQDKAIGRILALGRNPAVRPDQIDKDPKSFLEK